MNKEFLVLYCELLACLPERMQLRYFHEITTITPEMHELNQVGEDTRKMKTLSDGCSRSERFLVELSWFKFYQLRNVNNFSRKME
jgi:hypothetical protein